MFLIEYLSRIESYKNEQPFKKEISFGAKMRWLYKKPANVTFFLILRIIVQKEGSTAAVRIRLIKKQ